MGKDYYQVLGLKRNATSSEVRKAYKKLALKFHPDKNNNTKAEEKFKEIGYAYKILSAMQTKVKVDKDLAAADAQARVEKAARSREKSQEQGPVYTTSRTVFWTGQLVWANCQQFGTTWQPVWMSGQHGGTSGQQAWGGWAAELGSCVLPIWMGSGATGLGGWARADLDSPVADLDSRAADWDASLGELAAGLDVSTTWRGVPSDLGSRKPDLEYWAANLDSRAEDL